jgi:hypothetical protein
MRRSLRIQDMEGYGSLEKMEAKGKQRPETMMTGQAGITFLSLSFCHPIVHM